MGLKSSKGKGSYASYKTDNRAYRNKIRKLERHCRKFPEDEIGKENLERLRDPKNFKIRSKPLVPGSNPTIAKVISTKLPHVKTPGEQLSELLNISMPKFKKRIKHGKTPITIKKKRNVKKS